MRKRLTKLHFHVDYTHPLCDRAASFCIAFTSIRLSTVDQQIATDDVKLCHST